MSNESSLLTSEERLQELSDTLLSGVFHVDDTSESKRQYLLGQLPVKVFRDENFILYSIIFNFKDRGIVPDSEFLKLYLLRNTKIYTDNASFIDLSAYADLDENPYVGYTTAVINQYVRLSNKEETSMQEYKLAVEKYKIEYSAVEMDRAYSQARLILHDGVQVGRRFYQGLDDSFAYLKKTHSDIENMLDNSVGDGFIDSSSEAIVDNTKSKPEKVSDFDLIDELNSEDTDRKSVV